MRILIVVVVALALAGGAEAGEPCDVIRVFDGDTIKVNCGGREETVRLYGIDAPEMRHDWGKEARAFTKSLVEGKAVRLLERGRDHYGRLLAFVILPGGKSLNYELVRAGWARVYAGRFAPKSDATNDKYTLAEIAARTGKLGMWRRGFPQDAMILGCSAVG